MPLEHHQNGKGTQGIQKIKALTFFHTVISLLQKTRNDFKLPNGAGAE